MKILLVLGIITILTTSVVSAGFLDFITGNAVNKNAVDRCSDSVCSFKEKIFGSCQSEGQDCYPGIDNRFVDPGLAINCEDSLAMCQGQRDDCEADLDDCLFEVCECEDCEDFATEVNYYNNNYCPYGIGIGLTDFHVLIGDFGILAFAPEYSGSNDEVNLQDQSGVTYEFSMDESLDVSDEFPNYVGSTSLDALHIEIGSGTMMTPYANTTAVWIWYSGTTGESINPAAILDPSLPYADVFYKDNTAPYGPVWGGVVTIGNKFIYDIADGVTVESLTSTSGVVLNVGEAYMTWDVDSSGISSLGESSSLEERCELVVDFY